MQVALVLVCLTTRPCVYNHLLSFGYTSTFLEISFCRCIQSGGGGGGGGRQYWDVTIIILFLVPSQCQDLAGKATERKLLRSQRSQRSREFIDGSQ